MLTTEKVVNFTSKVGQNSSLPQHSERNFFSERFQKSTLLVDVLFLNLSIFFGIFLLNADLSFFSRRLAIWLAFIISANSIWITIAMYNDIYKWYEIIRPFKKVQTLLYVNGIFFATLSSLYYYVYYPILEINFLLPIFFLFCLFSITAHLFFRQYYQKKMPVFKYVVVGGETGKHDYINHIYNNLYQGRNSYLGAFSNTPSDGKKWLGKYTQIQNYILNHSIDKLFYINSDLSKKDLRKIIELCSSRFIDFEVFPKAFDIIEGESRIINQERLFTIAPKIEPLQRLRNILLKRAFDILFSLGVIFIVFPWLFPIIALVIKFESKGPVFFFQDRTGYWNKNFKFIKFRSMTINKMANSKQAVKNDARVTKVGAFLRKTSLDELPQFFNVLIGDMSVVGPRPHMLKHTEEYSNLIDTYMIRHRVKPGITGWAQINGFRGPTEELYKMEKRVEFDVHYMKYWTFLMDMRCVVFTIVNMIRGEKNAF